MDTPVNQFDIPAVFSLTSEGRQERSETGAVSRKVPRCLAPASGPRVGHVIFEFRSYLTPLEV